jgi:hypothetical protein
MKTGDPVGDDDEWRLWGCVSALCWSPSWDAIQLALWIALLGWDCLAVPYSSWKVASLSCISFHIRSQWPRVPVSLCLARLGFFFMLKLLSVLHKSKNSSFSENASKPQVPPVEQVQLPWPSHQPHWLAAHSPVCQTCCHSTLNYSSVQSSPLYLGLSFSFTLTQVQRTSGTPADCYLWLSPNGMFHLWYPVGPLLIFYHCAHHRML